MSLVVRPEEPDDADDVLRVEEAAFGRLAEAELVEALRSVGAVVLSLVAIDAAVVGHALFTEVSYGTGRAVALGPLAVHPEHQSRGVGTALVREGLSRLSRGGHGALFVVGDPTYYRRFGFVPASRFGARWDRVVADEVFMALELRPKALAAGGIVRYHAAFDRV